jgi:Tfp pilus assembly protein PilF
VAGALDGLARPEEAIEELKTALAKSPAGPNLHFAIGYIYWTQQKDEDAEREFRLELVSRSWKCASMGLAGGCPDP